MSEPTGMKIGEVAEQTGLSIRTLRHYDELGVVTPSGRTPGGFRLYSEVDVERLLLIRRMKPLEFSLEEIRTFLLSVDTLRTPTQAPAPGDVAPDRAAPSEPERNDPAAPTPAQEPGGEPESPTEARGVAAANLRWIQDETTTRLAKLRQRVSYAEEFLTLLDEVAPSTHLSPTDGD